MSFSNVFILLNRLTISIYFANLKIIYTSNQKQLLMKHFRITGFSFLIISGFLFFSCGSSQKFPSVSDTKTLTYNPGQVVWRDLVSPDPKKAADFYKKVFGWTVEKTGSDDNPYWVFKNHGKRIAGMFEMTEAKKDAGGEWISYVSVNSVEDAAAMTGTSGGAVLREPVEMEGRGTAALLSDAQKAIFAVIRSTDGDPPASREALANEWLWSELWSTDADASENFYKKLLKAEVESKEIDSITYKLVNKDGRRCLGIIKTPAEKTRSYWLQYIKVADVEGALQRAVDEGATVLIPPTKRIRNGSVAVLLDPVGAPFAIQVWPFK